VDVLRARAYLSRVAEPPAPALAAFVEVLGPVTAAARVRVGDVPDPVAGETAARRTTDRADADLEAARVAGARLLVPEDAAWPRDALAPCLLAGVPALAPPMALWVRGPRPAAELSERAVAVVGARAATSYGTHVAGELGAGLAKAGATVVSGAAIGIDGAAHRGSLAVDGATVAVLACGVDRVYPAAHATLLERIAATGLVVSEYPPGSVPARHRFLVRNRLIAALGAGTVVVEAALRSGAQRTATDTEALGRDRHGRAGPGHLGPVGRLSSADPRRSAAGHERGRRAGGRRAPRRGPGTGAGSARAPHRTGSAGPRHWCTMPCLPAGHATPGGWRGSPACHRTASAPR
jgi:DNA processing protein